MGTLNLVKSSSTEVILGYYPNHDASLEVSLSRGGLEQVDNCIENTYCTGCEHYYMILQIPIKEAYH